MDPWCITLPEVSSTDLPLVGGKAANLGELVRAGFRVPPGFVVTTSAYRACVPDSAPSVDEVRRTVLTAELDAAVRASYAQLGYPVVAVRSSATAEDLPGAAFAGQQDTVLGVHTADEVVDAIRVCWASLWGDRAVHYRARLGIAPDQVSIAVVIQQMVDPDIAGVMFTANPVTGDRTQTVIDSSPGLGEAVVAGMVTPNHAVLDARGRVVERLAGDARTVVRLAAGGGTHTDENGSCAAVLDDAELRDIQAQGRRAESHFGAPQDVEWALADGQLWILQSRPMTALPPPPRPLSRVQRIEGPVILELLPRRPLPMEVSLWIVPAVGRLVARMMEGLVGARVDMAAVVPTRDGVVQEFVPPDPRPTLRTPARVMRSLLRGTRGDPAAWALDPRQLRLGAELTQLSGIEPQDWDWQTLTGFGQRIEHLSDLLAQVRVEHLPTAGVALLRLRAVLALLRQGHEFAPLLTGAKTLTRQANSALSRLADMVRQDERLAAAFDRNDGEELLHVIQRDPALAAFREQLDVFLTTFGHRETSSALLLHDPTWLQAPETVLGLVRALASGGNDAAHDDPLVAAGALQRVRRQPLVRILRLGGYIGRLADAAARGVAIREDTHFEMTRTMPLARSVVLEAGTRLARAGLVDAAEDVWYLTWPEVSALADPAGADAGAGPHISVPDLRDAVRRRRAAHAELAASPLIATATLYPRSRATSGEGLLVSGVAGGNGTATGPVRVLREPHDFGTLVAGEILVCPTTNPTWTPLFARAAAVVVDHGGLGSHAAIVAREYGIPAVLGTGDGSVRLSTGQQVVVDGDTGEVRIDG